LATALLWKGAPLEDIAAILRHCSMETTQLYAKMKIPALRKIAQPRLELSRTLLIAIPLRHAPKF
jgi:site-specific recombinase XerD